MCRCQPSRWPGPRFPRGWPPRATTGWAPRRRQVHRTRAPVWGTVTSETLYLYSERSTVKARNIAADPRVVVHLESGEDVVIVRGVAEDLGTPGQVPAVVAALAAKYTRPEDRQYLPDADPDFDVVYAIRPRSAMMWRLADYAASQRRWSA